MFDLEKLRAVGAMVARQAREKAAADYEAANDIIDMSPLLKPWQEGVWKQHDVCVLFGLPYWCMMGHDSTGNPLWSPAHDTALWALYHGRDAAHALPFKAEGHNPYNTGHWMIWEDGFRYRSNMEGNVWTPEGYPEGWDGPFFADGTPVSTEVSV